MDLETVLKEKLKKEIELDIEWFENEVKDLDKKLETATKTHLKALSRVRADRLAQIQKLKERYNQL